ncbi:NAD(P)/FAD-dependent oxidoreductase [Aeromicrobium sp. 50.2.37]|uniref:flavin-containing monooxygenase n=1 Tax=Aeromicrobium sp. 50.2.37 TaxID=2969305 RepID=UPI0021505462|nr:NAD(P)/FAD-dependent oxidoreductase [Aeromicrobium sp. 50.2.37]MCR4512660.1 NAD(P)/FAD-dependent oxidoreductase [Aeromicrobium sp. 50.2.37]
MTAQVLEATEEFDIVIIGAGISGIGAATYFGRELPAKSLVVLEARDSIGGTWDLFRYPGIRSDSDLHTFGYEFKPWRHEAAIADAPLIREYLRETVAENDLARAIRLRHRVVEAEWSSDDARWTLTVEATDADGGTRTTTIRTRWVFAATGYYRYDQGFAPDFAGREDFQGEIVHPQHWPDSLDYAGKKVVVIGSGATAITLVPSLVSGPGAAAHVTMLQRTPTYVMALPRTDTMALRLTRLLGPRRGYAATRFKNIWIDRAVVKGLRTFPKAGRALIRHENVKRLPKHFDVDKHFNPPYDPWDQRLCLAPDGDFFASIREGTASVATGAIHRFSAEGVVLESGEEIPADVIVTATGLNMRLFDGMPIVVDGAKVDVGQSVAYRGMLLSGIPNWAMAIGYTTSSWTLKVSLICRYFIDLVRHMDRHGSDQVVPVPEDGMERRPVMDLQAGYARRAERILPQQGVTAPWRMAMAYTEDAKALRGPVADEHLHFGTSRRDASEQTGRLHHA